MLSLFHIYPFPSFQPYQSIIPLKLYITFIYSFNLIHSLSTMLFLHLHFTITFRQTTNSACAHQLRLAPQYDMHITSIIGASLSEPHIDELNARNPYIYIIGTSLSEPHIDELNARDPYIYYWGEPERALHRRVERSQSIYYYVWDIRHPRAAIEIVQEYAIYSNTT